MRTKQMAVDALEDLLNHDSGLIGLVLFHQRGLSLTGHRFDGEVLGFYKFREGKLARAQMFYFDTAAVSKFLAKALSPKLRQRARAVFDRFKSLPPSAAPCSNGRMMSCGA